MDEGLEFILVFLEFFSPTELLICLVALLIIYNMWTFFICLFDRANIDRWLAVGMAFLTLTYPVKR